MEKDELSESEHVILVVEAMEREVNNGGFEQFFVSSSVEHAPTLVPALEQIGAPKTAEIADRAACALGAEPDWPPERYEVAAAKADDFTLAALSECDHAYHASGEAICALLFEYIKTHRTDIDLSAE